jgi:hypothetical protein
VVIGAIPYVLVWPLNMKIGLKIKVVVAFSFRLLLLALSGLHLSYFQQYPDSAEPQFSVTDSLLFQQVMLTWSLIAATIPNLKAFMKSFSTGFGLALGGDGSMTNSYPMRSYPAKSSKTDSNGTREIASRSGRPRYPLRPDVILAQTTIHADHHDRLSDITTDGNSTMRAGSQDLIIRREVEWDVRSESR